MTTVENLDSGNISEDYRSVEAEKEVPVETKKTSQTANPFFAIFDYFYGVNPVLERRELGYLPVWVEKGLGNMMYPMMTLSQGGAMNHHFELPKVNQILGNLKAHARRDLPYEVQILNKDVVNAWCLPGGKMAIYKRILERIDYFVNNKEAMGLKGYTHPETGEFISYQNVTKEDVIAALLGHEMTHADARHAARKLELSFVAQIGIFGLSYWAKTKIDNKEALLEKNISKLSYEEVKKEKDTIESYRKTHKFFFNWLVKLGVELYFLMGSRHHELEADKYGTRLAVEAGYNPVGALFLQEILKKESHGLYDYLPTWYQKLQGLWSSHPPSTERQAALFADVKVWMAEGA